MYRSEPKVNPPVLRVAILALPAALAAALSAYALVLIASGDHQWGALAGAVAGGWTLGRMKRRRD